MLVYSVVAFCESIIFIIPVSNISFWILSINHSDATLGAEYTTTLN